MGLKPLPLDKYMIYLIYMALLSLQDVNMYDEIVQSLDALNVPRVV